MKSRAQRRKNTRRVIRQRMRLFEQFGWDDAKELRQKNRLSKYDFNSDQHHDYPEAISTRRKLEKMNDLDEGI
jgi:hypothetical protein